MIFLFEQFGNDYTEMNVSESSVGLIKGLII